MWVCQYKDKSMKKYFKFEPSRSYRGCISYVKTKEGNIFHIVKNRPFKKQSYRISREDYRWCDNHNKASSLWYYSHMHGTCYHYEDKNIHPRTKVKYSDEKRDKDDNCALGIHTLLWFNKETKICSNCKEIKYYEKQKA